MYKENIKYRFTIITVKVLQHAAVLCQWIHSCLSIFISAMNTFCSRSTTVSFCWKNLLFRYKFQSKSICESHCPVCRKCILVQGLWTT